MKQFYFKSIFLSLLMMVFGNAGALAQDKWVATAPGDLAEGDVVVIVDLNDEVAMPNDGGGSSAPVATKVTLSDDKTQITSTVADNLMWTVKRSGEVYQFYATETTWLYCTTSNNGVRVGTNSNNHFNIVVDPGNNHADYLFNTDQSCYLGVYIASGNAQDWRRYGTINANIKGTITKFFKKVASTTPELIAINETNFPDDVFRAWVAENCDKADDNGDKDGYLDVAEIAAQEVIGINGKDIEDLKGIEYFTAATVLMCDQNKLTSLDVSKNTALTQLICFDNQLTSLDVSKNTVLGLLHCTDNQLTSLDVSKNTNLETLLCQNNQLTSLVVSSNGKLNILDCSNNLINETEMGKLVASMPTVNGDFYPFNLSVEDANVITTTQVDEAKDKNWKVQAWNGSTYEDYAGVEPTPDTNEYYEKVTIAPLNWSGEYLIVYEEGSVAFDSSLQSLDAPYNTIEVVIDNGKIKATNAVKASAFTIEETDGGYSIKSTSGNYIGVTTNSNGLKQSSSNTYAHNLSINDDGNAVIAAVFDGSTMTLRYNSGQNDKRFRYYKDGQKAIQLYKKTVALDNQYTLVTVEDEGETETAFDGNTLTKELPASTKFYIKDNSGNKYYGTADDYGVATIFAENHENVPTSATGANFYLRKANTWVFTVAELETTEGITLTVNPETAGETKYMITPSEIAESEDVFDENLRLTKVMTTNGFYLMRSDDYGLFELTAAESNVSEGATQYYIWEFSEQNPTVGFLVNKRINTYRVDKAGTYTFTLDTENKTLTAEFVSGKQYTLVASDGTEYPFEGLTLTQELTGRTVFYIKDNTGKEYYATENTEEAIISAENHENLPTYESGNNFLLKKANTWVFTITELTGADGITLSVNPETAGDTKYMISQSLTEETEDVFDESLQLTKEMDTTPFYIIRSDDYGIFEISANRRTNPEGYARFTFTEDDNTVEFEAGKRLNMYEMNEEGLYTITLNLTNNTVTAETTTTVTVKGNLNNTDVGVFAGITGFTTGTNSASGTLKTGVGNVTVDYAGTRNSYLNDKHIRTYSNGTTLKFTAPEGYELRGIDITFSSGSPDYLETDPNDTYTSNTENKLGSWSGRAKTVTFIGRDGTSQLTTAEVTLMKAPLSPALERIDVEGYTTEFLVGDTYTFDGTATVTYEDGSTKVVTSEVEVFGPDMSSAGDKSATISYTENDLSVVAVISIYVREPQTITFRKITSTDELVAGKRYVLVNEEAQKVIAEYYNLHFNVKDAPISDEQVALTEGQSNFLTLGGEEDGWTFATSIEAGKYLALTTPNSNYLESKDDGEAAKWTISFDEDGNAVIKSNYITSEERVIMYNSSQPRFACYKGTQKPVQLYVESDLEDVTLTISAVGFATLYYSDRALKVPEGVMAKTYKVVGGKLAESKKYEAGSKIPKGEAVVLKGAPGDYTFKVTSTAEPKDANSMLKGSDAEETTTGGTYYYALQAKSKDGKHGPGFYWMNSTGEAFTNGVHKAYMALDKMFGDVQEVGGAKSFYTFEEATGISSVALESDGQVKAYNLNGQRVGSGYKGVVIVNGKKIMIK